MVDDIVKATSAYRNLSPLAKRIFREETGLNSTKRRVGGRRKTATKAKAAEPVRGVKRRKADPGPFPVASAPASE